MVNAPELSLRGRFAPVAISQYPVESLESLRRKRNCLPEIATSAVGLLAMTNRGPYRFYDSRFKSAVYRRAWLSPPLQNKSYPKF